MKITLGSSRHHFITGVSIVLIAVALNIGIVGCDGGDGNGESYALHIASTSGGSVTAPGEGMFTYDEGAVVNLIAEADGSYQFVNWAGDVSTIADVDTATTTITMSGDYSITANFRCITQVAAGSLHTIGLKPDGTVVTGGSNGDGQCTVGNWTAITQVAARGYHTVGLKRDGTVVAVGLNDDGQCDVDGWGRITQVAAGWYHTVAVKTDGTAVAVGLND
ncbi:MAG: hypothetical protein JSW22_01405, partial [Chloroflexota bacterium]